MPKRSKRYKEALSQALDRSDVASDILWNALVPEADKSIEGQFAWDDATVIANAEPVVNLDITIPQDVAAGPEEMTSAPTQKPARPRAWSIGYNPSSKVVYIVFRDNTWWQYNDVSTDVWLGLKNSDSTNDYLPTLESACSSHHSAILEDMSEASREKLSYTASIASSIQNTPMFREVQALRAQRGMPDISQ